MPFPSLLSFLPTSFFWNMTFYRYPIFHLNAPVSFPLAFQEKLLYGRFPFRFSARANTHDPWSYYLLSSIISSFYFAARVHNHQENGKKNDWKILFGQGSGIFIWYKPEFFITIITEQRNIEWNFLFPLFHEQCLWWSGNANLGKLRPEVAVKAHYDIKQPRPLKLPLFTSYLPLPSITLNI